MRARVGDADMTTMKQQLTIDAILDDAYRMGSVIDYGGYALIYEATRLADGETVAIKVLRQDATALDRHFGAGSVEGAS